MDLQPNGRRRALLAAMPALALAGLAAGCRHGVGAGQGTQVARPVSDLRVVADGLGSPEGVAAFPDGRVVVSAAGAGCVLIEPSGRIHRIGHAPAPAGLAIDAQGRILIANFGLLHGAGGPLQRLDLATGASTLLAERVDGRLLVASNAPAVGPDGAIYCTHSTWSDPANVGTTEPAGFVYRVAADGAVTRVASGIRGANGCCFDADFAHLYVAQTAAGNIVRLRRQPDGGYGDAEIWGPALGEAPDDLRVSTIFDDMTPHTRSLLGHPDGIALDRSGTLWIAMPFANRIISVTSQGRITVVVDDPEQRILHMPTSLAWGGAGLSDLYVVSRRNGRVLVLADAGMGLPLPHWTV